MTVSHIIPLRPVTFVPVRREPVAASPATNLGRGRLTASPVICGDLTFSFHAQPDTKKGARNHAC